jgi:hypothetical protein
MLAHGALGIFDELIFAAIALIFLGIVAYSWFMSRRSQAEDDEPLETTTDAADHIAVE